VAGRRLVALLKGVEGMPTDVARMSRVVLLNAAEHPQARQLLTVLLPVEQQQGLLGPLPQLPPQMAATACS
jgi:hypothetical protein